MALYAGGDINVVEEVDINSSLDSVPVVVATPVPVRPQSAMLRRWVPLLVKFASIQVVVQILGFASGILVVRNLVKAEYALYTLGNTMLATILLIADSGVSSALTSIGGRVWQDRGRLSQLMKTALHLRRWMLGGTLVIVLPVLLWLLIQNGATRGKASWIVGIVVLGCGLEVVTRIYAVALRLKSEVGQIQKQALVAAAVKFAIVALALTVKLTVEVALLAVAAGFATQYWMLRRWHLHNLDVHAERDITMRHDIVAIVRKQAPLTIYYCLQAQITVWLISVFGNATSVADVGALSRLAMVFTIIGSVTSELVFPAFARLQVPALLRRRYVEILVGFSAISAVMVLATILFPHQILAILGSQYQHLESENVLMAISTVLGAMANLAWGLNTARSWILPAAQFIPAMLVTQVGLVWMLNLTTVKGVLYLSIFSILPSVLWAIGFGLWRIQRLERAV